MISLQEGQGPDTQRDDDRMLVLRMTVLGCKPTIWRRMRVAESMWLSRLHDAIQLAFDWYDYQTHAFTIRGQRYGNPLKREGFVIDDDRDITLADVEASTLDAFTYGYHFGEGWQVEIIVEDVKNAPKNAVLPKVLAGERAGPPEDCGGIEAFHDMLACIAEPHTELGQEWLNWLGPNYDATRCDLTAINNALSKLEK